MNEYTVVDIWRVRNPDKFAFTWKRHTPRAYARLDYFLIPAGIANLVNYTGILPGYKSDYSLIQMVIEFEKVDRLLEVKHFSSRRQDISRKIKGKGR